MGVIEAANSEQEKLISPTCRWNEVWLVCFIVTKDCVCADLIFLFLRVVLHCPHCTWRMNNQWTTSPLKIGLDVIQKSQSMQNVFRSIPGLIMNRGDWEMGTAISCTECSQMAGLTKGGRDSLKALSLQMCSYMFYSLHAELDLDYS